jgi:hypothetical protein
MRGAGGVLKGEGAGRSCKRGCLGSIVGRCSLVGFRLLHRHRHAFR